VGAGVGVAEGLGAGEEAVTTGFAATTSSQIAGRVKRRRGFNAGPW
jgi:hypothetical protein